ncbi:MAG: nucleotide exchange factor GrpE [Betaproteobacteria bacterium]|nr:nucleotide exchange factor GrpE [Betaproteobacteria bacterium]
MNENIDAGASSDAPPAEGGNGETQATPSLEQLLAQAESKLQEQRDAWLRAMADAENIRRRAQLDVASAYKFGAERLVEMLLPVIDSLEAALGIQAGTADSLRSGVELTLKQLKGVLEKASVSEISPAAGEKFDPNRHHAMAAVEDDADPNTVVHVMQKGYALHERVVRPALVSVAKARES